MRAAVPHRLTGLLLCLLLAAAGCGGGAAEPVADADDVADPSPAAAAEPAASPTGPGEGEKTEAALTLPEEPAGDEPAGEEPAEGEPPPGDGAGDGEPADGPPAPPTEDVPGGRYVQLTGISLEGDAYSVAFTPYNFTPLIGDGPDDYHVHFFFDTVAPENAGTNGPSPGDWFLYDGPSPFTGYTTADRPDGATQLCALVADRAHAVTLQTGNCLPLP